MESALRQIFVILETSIEHAMTELADLSGLRSREHNVGRIAKAELYGT